MAHIKCAYVVSVCVCELTVGSTGFQSCKCGDVKTSLGPYTHTLFCQIHINNMNTDTSYPITCMYSNTYICICTRKCVCVCVYIYIYILHTHTHTHTHSCIDAVLYSRYRGSHTLNFYLQFTHCSAEGIIHTYACIHTDAIEYTHGLSVTPPDSHINLHEKCAWSGLHCKV